MVRELNQIAAIKSVSFKNWEEWLKDWKGSKSETHQLSLLHTGSTMAFLDEPNSSKDTIDQLTEKIFFYIDVAKNNPIETVQTKAMEILIHPFLGLLIYHGTKKAKDHCSMDYLRPSAMAAIEEVVDLFEKESGPPYLSREPYREDVNSFVSQLGRVCGEYLAIPPTGNDSYDFFCKKREQIIRILIRTGDYSLITQGKIRGAVPIFEEMIADHLWRLFSSSSSSYPYYARIETVYPQKADFIKALDAMDEKALRIALDLSGVNEEVMFVIKKLILRIPHPLEMK
jgi:hypothetical protein